MDRFGVDCALKRRLRRSRQRNEGRHVDLALYARMWGRRLPERRSHSDGARRAAPAPVAKSNVAGPERRAAPGRPPLFCAWSPLASRQCLRFTLPRRAIVLLPKLSSLKPVSARKAVGAARALARHSALKTRVNALTTGERAQWCCHDLNWVRDSLKTPSAHPFPRCASLAGRGSRPNQRLSRMRAPRPLEPAEKPCPRPC